MKPLSLLVVTALLSATLIACTSTSDPPASTVGGSAMPLPQQRSYLDPGPGAPRSAGPNYVRANQSNGPRQTDFFGNDVLPQNP